MIFNKVDRDREKCGEVRGGGEGSKN